MHLYHAGPSAAETLKHLLVSTLWDHLVAMESPLWKHCQSSGRAAFPIQVVRGLLGRPHLLLGEYQGPAISFSEGGGKVWAALCGDESDIGIDVAGPDEFQRESKWIPLSPGLPSTRASTCLEVGRR